MVEHDPITAFYQLSRRLEAAWLPPCPDETHVYGYEPLPYIDFINGMSIIGQARGRRYLDVGCGIGTNLTLAYLLGWENITGLEIRPQYAAIARSICPEAKIEEHDAFLWDGFNNFDVIYMYRPCVPDNLESKLENSIIEKMRPGTLLFLPMRSISVGESLGANVWRL